MLTLQCLLVDRGQIRRGDACGQTRPCIDIDLYSEAVVRLTDTYGIKLVYLATDDPDAIAEVYTHCYRVLHACERARIL